jgi:hypothetical protein
MGYETDPDVAAFLTGGRRTSVEQIPTKDVAPKKSAMSGKNPQLQPDANVAPADYSSDPDVSAFLNVTPAKSTTQNPPGQFNQMIGKALQTFQEPIQQIKGLGEAGATALTGAIAAPLGAATGVVANLRSGKYGTQEGIRVAEEQARNLQEQMTYQPKTEKGQQYVQNLQKVFEASKLPPVGVPEVLGMAPLATPATQQAIGAPAQLKAGFQKLKGELPTVRVEKSGMQSGGAAAAVPENVLRGNIDAALSTASPELQTYIQSKPTQSVNIPALETRALEEKHGVNLLTSQRTGDTQGYSEAWNSRSKNGLVADFEQQPKQLAKAFEESKRRHAPDITSEADASDLGQKMINSLTETDTKLVEGIDNAYKKFRDEYVKMRKDAGLPIEGDFPVNGNDFLKQTQVALKNEQLHYDVPASIKSILDDIKENNGKMTYSEFLNLDKRLSAKTKEGNGSERAAAFLIRQKLNDIALEPEAAALQPFYENARGLAKQRFDIIKSNPAYRKAIGEAADLKEASSQGESLNAAKFHQQFVSNATPEAIRRLKAQIPKGDIAHQAIAFAELERAKRAITNANESRIKSDQFADFIRNNKSVLREALPPEAMQDLMEIGLLNTKIGKPDAGTFNYSNSWSSMMGDLAKDGLLGLGEAKLAVATSGASVPAVGGLKMMFEKMNKDAFVNSQRNPYGGLTKE